ncbi:hypothetical protein R3I94_001423 [Phoxinus phoxinus]
MMSLICFQSQPPESSGYNQTTHENRGSDVTLDYIVKDLLSFFNGFKCLHETKKKIEDKCDIKKEHVGCWSADDIKQAWKKTQIMRKKSSGRQHWARVIMLQVLKTCLYYDGFNRMEAQSDPNVAAEITSSETEQVPPEIPSSSETKNNMDTKATQNDDSNTITTIKEEECLEHLDQSLAELCVSNKENVKEQTMTENPPGGEKKVMVQPHSDFSFPSVATKRSQRVSQDFDTFETNNENYPNTRQKEKREKMEDGIKKGVLNKSSSQTVYIRIPLSVMSGNESTCKLEEVKNDNPTYKLIDRVPNLTDIRKRKSYVMLHDNRTRNAAWVYEILNTSIIGQDDDHQNDEKNPTDFKVDNSIHPFYQAPESNKSHSTKHDRYDRGHLAAAANHKWCQEACRDTYLISNMAQQHEKLNRGKWKSLEQQCRKDIKEKKHAIRNIHVYTGPLYLPNNQSVSYKMVGDKAVPTHFFKVIIVEKWDDTVELKCYQMPNRELFEEFFEVSIESIEKASGLIFRESSYNRVTDSMRTVTWSENEHEASTQVKISTLHTD